MFRVSKVWLLILIQLIAGSGRDIYLCIDSDGTIAGLDAGPQFCINCDHEADANEACSADSARCTCCSHTHKSESCAKIAESCVVVTTDHDCDCEHRLISSEDFRSVSRVMRASQHGSAHAAILLPSPAKLLRAIAFQPLSPHHSPPPNRADSIAFLSTVVIRS